MMQQEATVLIPDYQVYFVVCRLRHVDLGVVESSDYAQLKKLWNRFMNAPASEKGVYVTLGFHASFKHLESVASQSRGMASMGADRHNLLGKAGRPFTSKPIEDSTEVA